MPIWTLGWIFFIYKSVTVKNHHGANCWAYKIKLCVFVVKHNCKFSCFTIMPRLTRYWCVLFFFFGIKWSNLNKLNAHTSGKFSKIKYNKKIDGCQQKDKLCYFMLFWFSSGPICFLSCGNTLQRNCSHPPISALVPPLPQTVASGAFPLREHLRDWELQPPSLASTCNLGPVSF